MVDWLTLLVTGLAVVVAWFIYNKTSKLSKKLTPPAVELVEIKHVIKENKEGYETFAVFKNNTQEVIDLHYSGNLSKKGRPHAIRLNGIGTNIVSFLFNEEKVSLNPGSLKNVKIADMSLSFIKSQEFYRLDLFIDVIKFVSKYIGVEVNFHYFHNKKKKQIIATVYPYEYDMSKLKSVDYFNYRNDKNQNIKTVFLVLNKEYDKLRNKYPIYIEYTKNSVKKYASIKNEDSSWKDSYLYPLRYVSNDEKEAHGIFFGNSEKDISENIMKHVNAIVVNYDGMTYVKSYINKLFSGKYIKNNLAVFQDFEKIKQIDKCITEYRDRINKTVKNNNKENTDMNEEEKNDKSFNEKLNKFFIISMIPLSIIGLILIGVVGTLIFI